MGRRGCWRESAGTYRPGADTAHSSKSAGNGRGNAQASNGSAAAIARYHCPYGLGPFPQKLQQQCIQTRMNVLTKIQVRVTILVAGRVTIGGRGSESWNWG